MSFLTEMPPSISTGLKLLVELAGFSNICNLLERPPVLDAGRGGAEVEAAGTEGFAGLVADQGREGGVAMLVPAEAGVRGGGAREPKRCVQRGECDLIFIPLAWERDSIK